MDVNQSKAPTSAQSETQIDRRNHREGEDDQTPNVQLPTQVTSSGDSVTAGMNPLETFTFCSLRVNGDGSLGGDLVEPHSHRAQHPNSRTTFTDEDDDELRAWVSNAEREGILIVGPKVFQDLASVVSMRNRFSPRQA